MDPISDRLTTWRQLNAAGTLHRWHFHWSNMELLPLTTANKIIITCPEAVAKIYHLIKSELNTPQTANKITIKLNQNVRW